MKGDQIVQACVQACEFAPSKYESSDIKIDQVNSIYFIKFNNLFYFLTDRCLSVTRQEDSLSNELTN